MSSVVVAMGSRHGRARPSPGARRVLGLVLAAFVVLGVGVFVPAANAGEAQVAKSIALFYRAGDGVGAAGTVDSDGRFTNMQNFTGLATGWTHIVPVGDGRLFFYRAGDGVGALVSVGVDGLLTVQRNFTGLLTGWTNIVYADNGQLLFYRASDGLAVTAVMRVDGLLVGEQNVGGFVAGWTNIVHAGNGRVLFYRAGDGLAATGVVNNGFTNLKTFGLVAGWTQITPAGGGRLLFNRAGDGLAATGSVDSSGTFTNLKSFGLVAGWTQITPVGGGRLLFYRASDGLAATGSVGTDGTFTSLQQVGGFVTGWNLVATAALEVPQSGPSTVTASATAVTISWIDGTQNETGWDIYKRNSAGDWALLTSIPTRNTRGIDDKYSYTDTATNISGQCYVLAPKNSVGSDFDERREHCKVRTDPAAFPQTINTVTQQWETHPSTLKNHDAGWELWNRAKTTDQRLILKDHNHLEWWNILSPRTAEWEIHAQGGPTLVKGQLVALKVGDGGWLHFNGTKLTLAGNPSYEWRSLGSSHKTGVAIPPEGEDGVNPAWSRAEFALWNDVAHDFLVYGEKVTGPSGPDADSDRNLNWFKQTAAGGGTPQPFTASLSLQKQPIGLGHFFPYVGTYPPLGTVPPFHLIQVRFPSNGFVDQAMLLVKPGHSTEECGNPNAVIPLVEGQSLTSAQITTIWGSAQPHFTGPFSVVACWSTLVGSPPPPQPNFVDLELTVQND